MAGPLVTAKPTTDRICLRNRMDTLSYRTIAVYGFTTPRASAAETASVTSARSWQVGVPAGANRRSASWHLFARASEGPPDALVDPGIRSSNDHAPGGSPPLPRQHGRRFDTRE